jgi:hypothetical protein
MEMARPSGRFPPSLQNAPTSPGEKPDLRLDACPTAVSAAFVQHSRGIVHLNRSFNDERNEIQIDHLNKKFTIEFRISKLVLK